MKLQKVISAAAFAMTVLASAQGHAANNSGQPESALRASVAVANAAIVNPFKKECAAITKAKFASTMTRGSENCAFGEIGPSKNLADFTHPEVGVYCFKPSTAAGFSKNNKLYNVLPVVNVEWGRSSGYELLAYHLDPSSNNTCNDGYIEVKTYDFSTGNAVASDSVAFTIQVF